MTKKNMKIIGRVINSNHDKCKKVLFDVDTGFYYATDGYRIVRIDMSEMTGSDLPIFDETDEHYDCAKFIRNVADKTYTSLFIPYTIEQIKAWQKNEKKNKRRTPFTLGVKYHLQNGSSHWMGINPTFLIDAMTTTGSNYLLIPEIGTTMLMEGKGYLWLIQPIQCKDWDCNHVMTEIDIEGSE